MKAYMITISLMTSALLIASPLSIKEAVAATTDICVIAEDDGRMAVYLGDVGSALTSIDTFERHCKELEGYGFIGKQAVGALAVEYPNDDRAKGYLSRYSAYPKQGITLYDGWYRCNADKGAFKVSKGSDLPLLNIISEGEVPDRSALFAGYDDLKDTRKYAISLLIEAQHECMKRRGRGVVTGQFNDGTLVPFSNLMQSSSKGVFTTSDLEKSSIVLSCADTKESEDEFTATIQKDETKWHSKVVPGIKTASLEGEIRNAPLFTDEKREPDREGMSSDAFHTSARMGAELDVARQTFDLRASVIASINGRQYEGIYMGVSGSCELVAVINTPSTPPGMRDAYRDDKVIENIENFKRCGEEVSHVGKSYDTTLPEQLRPDIERSLSLCKIDGTAMIDHNGYKVACKTKGNDADRVYEFTVVRKDRLVSRFYRR